MDLDNLMFRKTRSSTGPKKPVLRVFTTRAKGSEIPVGVGRSGPSAGPGVPRLVGLRSSTGAPRAARRGLRFRAFAPARFLFFLFFVGGGGGGVG